MVGIIFAIAINLVPFALSLWMRAKGWGKYLLYFLSFTLSYFILDTLLFPTQYPVDWTGYWVGLMTITLGGLFEAAWYGKAV